MNKKLCEYGCGLEAKYTLKNKKSCCKKSPNKCLGLRKKNSAGIIKAFESGNKSKINIFGKNRGWSKGKNLLTDDRIRGKYKKFSDIFCINSPVRNSYLRKLIFQNNLMEYKCNNTNCNILSEWLGQKIVLELDHINGIHNDNRIENLRFLCPNCHSQTETFNRVKNTHIISKKGVNDNMIKKEIKKGLNNHQICKKLKISLGNHKRINLVKLKLSLECIKCGFKLKGKTKTGMCSKCIHNLQRKVDRPPYLELISMINEIGYVKVGKKYNVSDNAIRKWVKNYESEINNKNMAS